MEEKVIKFEDFGLCKDLLKGISEMGFEEPTPIQVETISTLLTGKDMIGQAQTGTGKTAAFGIPIINGIDKDDLTVQALVLEPTRELALQAAEEINQIGSVSKTHALPVYGGTNIERQIHALEKGGVHLVVGTPGRILDHLQRRTLSLSNVKIVVLDEADEMLDMGFIDDINSILKRTPSSRQTMLFSATMPDEILRIGKRYMKDPEMVKVKAETLTAPKIAQVYYEVRHTDKIEALTRLIDTAEEARFLIFTQTKREADDVTSRLGFRGHEAGVMHGDYSQDKRERVLKGFRAGTIDVLVATDVAARGLDISDITHVVNYSIPQDPESYVHRIGRTGRMGKDGIAVTLVTPRERLQLRLIERVSRATITKGTLPTRDDIIDLRLAPIKEQILKEKDDVRFETYRSMAERLGEEIEPLDALAALIKMEIANAKAISSDPTAIDVTGVDEKDKQPSHRKPQSKSYSKPGGKGGGYKGGHKGSKGGPKGPPKGK